MRRAKENWYFYGFVSLFAVIIGRPSTMTRIHTLDVIVDVSGFALVFFGLIVRVVSRDWKVNHGDGRIVTDGPYAIVRNPMYLGSLIIGLGLCFIFGSPLFLFVFAALFFICHQRIVRREERFLALKYGDEYESYLRSTPRWLPSFTGFLRLFFHSFGWTKSAPRAILREKYAIGLNLMGAYLLEAAANNMVLGVAEIRSEVMLWTAVAACLTIMWVLSGKMLGKAAKPTAT